VSLLICALCRKAVWRGALSLGRHRLHKSCVDEMFESIWEEAHPKMHGGWSAAQIDGLMQQMIEDRLR
jgi:hypothetical protein